MAVTPWRWRPLISSFCLCETMTPLFLPSCFPSLKIVRHDNLGRQESPFSRHASLALRLQLPLSRHNRPRESPFKLNSHAPCENGSSRSLVFLLYLQARLSFGMADPYILLPMDYNSGSISRVKICHFVRFLLLFGVCSFVKASGGKRQILRAVIVCH